MIRKYHNHLGAEVIKSAQLRSGGWCSIAHQLSEVKCVMKKVHRVQTCADPESFVRGGPTLTTFFFIFFFSSGDGERIQMPLTVGHHRPASETPFRWRFASVPLMAHPMIELWLGSFVILGDPDQYC